MSTLGARAAEEFDRALWAASLGESRCISMRHVSLEVAAKCDGIDADAEAYRR